MSVGDRMKTVFVTGGAGYVGSHSCKAFDQAGWKVVTYDNLSRGWRDAVKWGPFVEGDISDQSGACGFPSGPRCALRRLHIRLGID
jgi:nucleoside-diphosphate-sugar epimerase